MQVGIADLEARKVAANALRLAFAEEMAAREGFVRAYDANAGAIRQLFPRDRETQNLYFDDFHGNSYVEVSPDPDDGDANSGEHP